MVKLKRKIIHIDEEKCDGCGICVSACAEGAIQIIDGKARLVSESYCDGLGNCLGECPQCAITIEEKEAEQFDEKAVKKHLDAMKHKQECACPGSAVKTFDGKKVVSNLIEVGSELTSWPIQLKLVPVVAPFLDNADILIAADCVSFAYANFHQKLLKGKVLIICCPKLDDAQYYKDKLTEILKFNTPKSILIAHMEVACCFGLTNIVKSAIKESGKDIVLSEVTVTINGELKQ